MTKEAFFIKLDMPTHPLQYVPGSYENYIQQWLIQNFEEWGNEYDQLFHELNLYDRLRADFKNFKKDWAVDRKIARLDNMRQFYNLFIVSSSLSPEFKANVKKILEID